MTFIEWIGLIIFFILSTIDWASTSDGYYRKGLWKLEESNPIARFFLNKGLIYFTGFKFVTTFGVIIPMLFWETGFFKSIMLVGIIILYGVIVIDNIRLLIARDQDYK